MTPMNTQIKKVMSQRIFNSNTCRILFATCLSALCLAALSTQAATITVINTADSEFGSLRQALADANDGDTIDFQAGISGTITLASELVVDKSVTINGPGAANLAVDGNRASRVFYIGSGRTVTIDSLTIMNGNAGDDAGGGIYNDKATLTVTNSILSGNSAGYRGGGILNLGEFGSATLTISNSTLSGNWSSGVAGYGGGIFNAGGLGSATLTISASTLSGNSSLQEGGGIYNSGGAQGSAPLTISNSTLSGNSATGFGGGGIYNDQATLTITNTTLSGNST